MTSTGAAEVGGEAVIGGAGGRRRRFRPRGAGRDASPAASDDETGRGQQYHCQGDEHDDEGQHDPAERIGDGCQLEAVAVTRSLMTRDDPPGAIVTP